jgi:hypothetical protein
VLVSGDEAAIQKLLAHVQSLVPRLLLYEFAVANHPRKDLEDFDQLFISNSSVQVRECIFKLRQLSYKPNASLLLRTLLVAESPYHERGIEHVFKYVRRICTKTENGHPFVHRLMSGAAEAARRSWPNIDQDLEPKLQTLLPSWSLEMSFNILIY